MNDYSLQILRSVVATLNPESYVRQVLGEPYEWQKPALDPDLKRWMLLCARQSGKSTVAAARTLHKQKYKNRSLNIIISASQDQAEETMGKVTDFRVRDRDFPELVKDSTYEKETVDGSRIIALPGTERSVRGYSGPSLILFDEAARIADATYASATPMLTGNPDAELGLASTPFGRQGFFWRAWESEKNWTKILVKPPYRLDSMDQLVPDVPEKRFREYWAERGVLAFYSTRHTREWLLEELDRMGPFWFRQEYLCEFLDAASSVFSDLTIASAMDESVDLLFDEAGGSEEVEMLF